MHNILTSIDPVPDDYTDTHHGQMHCKSSVHRPYSIYSTGQSKYGLKNLDTEIWESLTSTERQKYVFLTRIPLLSQHCGVQESHLGYLMALFRADFAFNMQTIS